ncbi:MAG: zinc-binding alcohol dehydrogenase [Chloroflexi bacterium]|nr:zinc-binding alcohol dehydrogenase [Chloroflexota bacterium]
MQIKAAVLHGPRDLRVEDRALAVETLKPDELWVQTEVSALSTGTDRGNYEGAQRVPGAPDYPRWVGYSNVGIVRGVGAAVTRLRVGERVFALKPHQSAYVARESELIVRVPPDVAPEDAAFTYLFHLGFQSLQRGHFVPGENVAVVGLGILGLASVELARAQGARVLALGNAASRLAVARSVGAHVALQSDAPELPAAIDELTHGTGIDLVILAANPWPAYRTAMEIVRPNGRVAVLSLPGRGEPPSDFNPLELEWFYGKALTIIAVAGVAAYAYPFIQAPSSSRPGEAVAAVFSRARGCEYLLDLMAERRLQPSRLITHCLPYQRMNEAYEMALHRDKSMIGVVFDWR